MNREPPLPRSRGPITEVLLAALLGEPGELPDVPVEGDPLAGDDLHLALYVCYELHYRGFAGVDERWEWNPSLVALRGRLEEPFEAAVSELYERSSWSGREVKEGLLELAEQPGPPLSRYLRDRATLLEFKETVVHKSAYQLKEADPQCWTIPRLEGVAKAAMVEVEYDEFGSGRADRIHAVLYRNTMEALGLDGGYGSYLDRLPGITLATVNLLSLFGLHRQWRGASVGNLALAEMTSARSNKLKADGLRRLGCGPDVTGFYDEHVVADSVHDMISLHYMAAGLARQDPSLSGDILFGAAAGEGLDGRYRRYVLDCFARGESSLYEEVPAPA